MNLVDYEDVDAALPEVALEAMAVAVVFEDPLPKGSTFRDPELNASGCEEGVRLHDPALKLARLDLGCDVHAEGELEGGIAVGGTRAEQKDSEKSAPHLERDDAA